jgi:NAD(P)-dependent dehydrogenase (short-subunit alcohol dehydrogenase family)
MAWAYNSGMTQLSGKRCLIVGGTSGIGLAAARRFLAEGARVVIAGRDRARGAVAVQELGGAHFVAADARNPEQVAMLFDAAGDHLGGLDVLYHVAGVSGRKFGDGPLHECADDGWHATLDANLTSVFLTNRAAVRHFLTAKQPGAILNMASVLGYSPSPRYFDTAAYAATKGGIIALSRYAASRYAADKIRVNVIAPALIDTPMATRAVSDAAIAEFLRTKQPLAGGPGAPEDCAAAAVLLCSDAAGFITGVVLPVDGGWCVSDGQWAADD